MGNFPFCCKDKPEKPRAKFKTPAYKRKLLYFRKLLEEFLKDNGSETIFDMEEDDTKIKSTFVVKDKCLHYLEYDSRLSQEKLVEYYKELQGEQKLSNDTLKSWRVRARYIAVFDINEDKPDKKDEIKIQSTISQGRGDYMKNLEFDAVDPNQLTYKEDWNGTWNILLPHFAG